VSTQEIVADMELSDELMQFIENWKDKRGNLIMILHRVQQEYGFLPWEVTLKLSEVMGVPLAKIYGVATFYHYFKLEKPGKHKVAVCMGTACYLKGAGDLIEEFRNLLDIDVNETTADEEFTMESVRCVGCCGLAPVVMVDDEVYGKLTNESLPEILAEYRRTDLEEA
jgi:NADH:ubiquinone oxidoreductase subunit E